MASCSLERRQCHSANIEVQVRFCIYSGSHAQRKIMPMVYNRLTWYGVVPTKIIKH